MKTYFNLRSTIGNSSWPRRGLVVLAALAVAAVVGIALMQALRPGMPADPRSPGGAGVALSRAQPECADQRHWLGL